MAAFAAAQARQILLFLRFGAERDQGCACGPHVGVKRKDQPVIAARVTQTFQCADGGKWVLTATAVVHRHREPLDSHRAALLPAVAIEHAVAVVFDQVAIKLRRRKSLNLVEQLSLRF